jgi:hypothetical protein
MRRPDLSFRVLDRDAPLASWMKTTATITPIASSGKKSFVVGPPSIHARIASGARSMIDAKISSEMPFPMPRFVICSPNHISSTVPAGQRDDDQDEPPDVVGEDPCRRKRYE